MNRQYFRSAISVTHELSTKLLQFSWRKLLPKERDEADSELNDVAFELMKNEDYQLAERLLAYGLSHTSGGEDLIRRMMAVNYANAIKMGGNKEKAIQQLDALDWSATSRKFQISGAAVKDDLKTVLELMPIVAKKDIDEEDFRTWPVFRNARGEKEFQEKFRDIFGSELIATPALAASKALRQSRTDISTPDISRPRKAPRLSPTKH